MIRFNINLASQAYLRKRAIALAVYLTSFLLVIGIGIDLARFFQIRKNAAAFDARINRVFDEKRRLQSAIGEMGGGVSEEAMKATRKEVQFVNDLLNQKSFSWTSFLSDFENKVPANISVNRIQPDFKNASVVVGGTARSLRELTEFVRRLQEGERFEDVFLTEQRRVEEGEKTVIGFSIRFKYHSKRSGA
ncbi:MAG TPA: PilN domain-containing protein [Candidatus Manganitrophaceae bacterium]|nr:PilN domain-containing protein [Candidatus Manganitrophaceae bacterium]